MLSLIVKRFLMENWEFSDLDVLGLKEAAKVEEVEDDDEELEAWRSGDDGDWDKELDDDDEGDDEAEAQKLQKLAAQVLSISKTRVVCKRSPLTPTTLLSISTTFQFVLFL